MRWQNNSTIFLVGSLVLLLLLPNIVRGEMSSANYHIYADSVGIGGVFSTSSDYVLNSATGESATGFSSSTGNFYELTGGYQAAISGESLSLTLESGQVQLGTLSNGSVSSANARFHVQSTSATGYTVAITNPIGVMPASVIDGQVSPGHDEYGVQVTGDDAQFSDDRAIVNGLVVASALHDVVSSTTTLTFKASYSSTAPGNYSQSVGLTASANF